MKNEKNEKKKTTTEKKDLMSDFKINDQLKKYLNDNKFLKPTEIQKKTIPEILKGGDILTIAKTGSGKTLCFLIPIISKILDDFREEDKLLALILTPTRELCVQIYDVLEKLTRKTKIKTCKVIGGIKTKKEKEKVQEAQILVCTPGRLIQHFSELCDFRTEMLDVLVIDEFDKMVELGFKQEVESILEYLPISQRLLFSATFKSGDLGQKTVKLENPKIISDFSENKVCHFYRRVGITEKINCLYSILKHHHKDRKQKTIVFFSTCKAAKFHYLLFSKFFGDAFLLCSSVSQKQRIESYRSFRSSPGILFCTDVASRGLDFEQVHQVIQFDCPDSAETYIHRSGRTGRNQNEGVSYSLLLPEELRLIEFLKNVNLRNTELAQTDVNLKEMEDFEIKKLDRKLKGIFRNDKILREFVGKYCTTYEKYLKINKKRFPVDSEVEIKKLKEYLGVRENFTK